MQSLHGKVVVITGASGGLGRAAALEFTRRGSRVILAARFKRQRAGVLINVGSILSEIGQPYVPSYVVSKFALRGLTETLRSALADEPNIHACSLLPYAIDTPHFEAGANYVGIRPHAMPPMQSPEKVARALAALAERPRRDLRVPRVAVLGLALHRLFPETTERALLHMVREWHFDFVGQRPTVGNLYAPNDLEGHGHGQRPQRIGVGGGLVWLATHFLRLALSATENGPARPSLQPHS